METGKQKHVLRAIKIHELGPGKNAAPGHERLDVQLTCENLKPRHSGSTAHHSQFSTGALGPRNRKRLDGEVQSFPLQYSTCEDQPKWFPRSAHGRRRCRPDINT